MATRTVKTELDVGISGAAAKLKLMKTHVSDFGKEWTKLGKTSKLSEIENGLQGVAVGLGVVLVASVMAAAKYEQAVSKMQAATRATSSQMASLTDATMAAGRGGVFSATEAAQAVTELGKASLTAQQIIDGGLKGALDLAAAGEMAVGEAAEFAASAMSMFELGARSVPHIADLLAAGAGKAQGEVKDMAMALSQSGLVAHQTGLTIEETTGALASFANAGLIGSDAGTSFKTMLMRLSGPTAEAAEKMKALGIDAFDASGKFVGLANFAGQLQTSLSTLTDEQRNAALTTIFGADAVRAAAIVYSQGAGGIQTWIDKVNDAGYAAEQAAIKNDNLMGDLKKLRGALEGALIGQGNGMTGALRDMSQGLSDVINWFSSLPPAVQTSVTWLLIGATAFTGIALGAAKASVAFSAAKTTLLGMGAAGQVAAKALTGVGIAMAWATKILVVVGAIWAFKQAVDAIAESGKGGPKALRFEVDELVVSLTNLGARGAASGEFAIAYGKNLETFGKTLGKYKAIVDEYNAGNKSEFIEGPEGTGYTDFKADDVAAAKQKMVEATTDADAALAQMVQNGYAGQAATSFDLMRQSLLDQGYTLDEVGALYPQYTTAVLGAQAANAGAANGFGTVSANAKIMAGTLTDAMNQGQSLIDVFNALNGAATQFAGAEIDAEAAVDDFKDAIEASGGSLDVSTAKGREAKQALLDVAESAAAAAQAKYQESGSVEEATAVYDDYIAQLRKSMLAAGMDEKAVDALIDTYARMPTSIFTELDTNADGVIDELDKLVRKFRQIPEYKHTTLYVSEKWTRDKLGADFANGGVVEYYASGGMRENHVAQIMPAGAMRVWAEPETGGEAYIPLSPAKRNRSVAIWEETGKRLGLLASSAFNQRPEKPTIANVNVTAVDGQFHLSQVEDDLRYRSLT